MILKRFAELKATEGYKLGYDWVKNHFKRKCKPNEVGLIGSAIEDLVTQGKIAINYDDEAALVLTKNGYDSLYKVDIKKTIKKLAAEIMVRFKGQGSLPNHVLILTWLHQNLSNGFNPKELELTNEAIQSLTQKGYVQIEEKNNFCIVLTQMGYDSMHYDESLKKAS